MAAHVDDINKNCYYRLEHIPADKQLIFIPILWIRKAFKHPKFKEIVEHYKKNFNQIQFNLNNRYYNLGYFYHEFYNHDSNGFENIKEIFDISEDMKLKIIDNYIESYGDSLKGNVRYMNAFKNLVYILCVLNWDIGVELSNLSGFYFIFECLGYIEIYDETDAEHVEFMKNYNENNSDSVKLVIKFFE